jgi:lipoprotein-anchoring transpeptidase ErfK/SrfK
MAMKFDRRSLLIGAPLLLSGCMRTNPRQTVRIQPMSDEPMTSYATADSIDLAMYGPITDEKYPVAAVDLRRVDPQYLRRQTPYDTSEPPGTIVDDIAQRHAYYVLANGQAIRYGVGVGREEGLNFQGEARIGRKAAWPRWTPTPDMIARDPAKYQKYLAGMDGGPMNPLGPRALYLYVDGKDSLFRLHGTVEPWSIGKMVSSGCIRFLNQDIIDLYGRTPVGARVVVQSGGFA